jgi:hypothetical protein
MTHEAKRPRHLTFKGLRTRNLTVTDGRPDCPDCGEPMGLCQPDSHYPSRMIASCGDCRTWVYLDGDSDDNDPAIITGIELPAPASEPEYPEEAAA